MSYQDERPEREDPRPYGAVVRPLVNIEHMDTPRNDANELMELYDKYPFLWDPHLEYSQFDTPQQADAMASRFRHTANLMAGSGKPNQTVWEWAEVDMVSNIAKLKLNKSVRGFGVKEAGTQTINQNQRVEQTQKYVKKHRFLPW